MKKIGRIKYVTRGVYDPETTYREMDVVLFEGSLWEPKKETTGNPPPDHQRNEDGTPASNEFWKLFLPGALGDDYVKKTDLAVQKTETSDGKPGISYPDGKTIFADENGMLTGATEGKRLKQEEMNDQLTSGELETGNVVYLTGPAEGTDGLVVKVDAELNADSVHAIRNSAVTNAINAANALIAENQRLIAETQALRSTLESFGLSKICPVGVTDATEANGIVLGAWEKNPSVDGSLASEVRKIANEMFKAHEPPTDLNTIKESGIYTIYNTTANAPVNYGVLLMFDTVAYAMQILKSSVVSSTQLFVRTRSNQADNNWGDWISYKPT